MDGIITQQSWRQQRGRQSLTVTGRSERLMDLVEMPFMRYPAMPNWRGSI
jgi:hypothetical protein